MHEDFHHRFATASQEYPFGEIFIQNDQLAPWFVKRMQRIDQICATHEICKHDINHHLRVARNAAVLNDCSGRTIPDPILFSLVFSHDLGYSMSGLTWDGKEAINHAQREKEVLTRWAKLFQPEALEYILRLPGSRHEVLAGMSESMDIFSVLLKFADGIDYFHVDRVDGLQAPDDPEDYFYLAKAVVDYQLLYDPQSKTIRYEVKLQKGVVNWLAHVESQYPEVWKLGRIFANTQGLEFEVIQT